MTSLRAGIKASGLCAVHAGAPGAGEIQFLCPIPVQIRNRRTVKPIPPNHVPSG